MSVKRSRNSQTLNGSVQKRKKVDKRPTADSQSDDIVGADDLDWREVALPDHLEDAGGFFGLEEIEGVDIVRSKSNGDLLFKVVDARKKPKKSALKTPRLPHEVSDNIEDDEWSGFSDEAPTEQHVAKDAEVSGTNESGGPKKQNEIKGLEGKNKQKDAMPNNLKNKQVDHSIKRGLSFAALQDQEGEDGVDVSAWDSLGLSPEALTSLSKLKFTTPTAVQRACIPHILDGHDVIGKASTGSGKTLAFAIPILEHYLERRRHNQGHIPDTNEGTLISLVLSPTRELAHQLAKHIGDFLTHAPGVDAKIALLTGGLSIQKQQRLLAGADIVIGTPGRIWEILSTGHGLIDKMKKIKYLVVDEADRLFSEGHFKEMEEILNALDRGVEREELDEDDGSGREEMVTGQRQTLVFSATFHRGLQQKLSGKGRWAEGDLMDHKESMEYLLKKLNFKEEKPKFVDVNPVTQMAEGLKEGIVECPAMEKDLYLYTLLLYHPKIRTLIFTNSISAVRRLTQLLQNLQLPAIALHSSMAQKARLRSVERFSSSSSPGSILAATDVAARGLDIKGIEFVIHYHAPRTADTYVHRSGRTARAGSTGKSVILCAPEEVVGVARLAAKVHANKFSGNQAAKKLPLESVELDRRVIARVRPRVDLAKRITNSTIAKEKISAEQNLLRAAAEDLGVDYDSEEFEETNAKGRGRGRGRQRRDQLASSVTKAEMAGMRATLKQLLSQRVNVGVSEKYITSGRVDIEALLTGEGNNSFLGQVDPLKF